MASGGRRQSKCKLCGVIKPNKADRWKDHTKKCQGLKHLAERRNLGAFVSASGEKHRQMLVDTYLLTYFVYKERYAFTLPAKLKEVLPYLHCVDNVSAAKLPLSNDTVSRYGQRISNSIIHKNKEALKLSFAGSIMFDETSDVQMRSFFF